MPLRSLDRRAAPLRARDRAVFATVSAALDVGQRLTPETLGAAIDAEMDE